MLTMHAVGGRQNVTLPPEGKQWNSYRWTVVSFVKRAKELALWNEMTDEDRETA